MIRFSFFHSIIQPRTGRGFTRSQEAAGRSSTPARETQKPDIIRIRTRGDGDAFAAAFDGRPTETRPPENPQSAGGPFAFGPFGVGNLEESSGSHRGDAVGGNHGPDASSAREPFPRRVLRIREPIGRSATAAPVGRAQRPRPGPSGPSGPSAPRQRRGRVSLGIHERTAGGGPPEFTPSPGLREEVSRKSSLAPPRPPPPPHSQTSGFAPETAGPGRDGTKNEQKARDTPSSAAHAQK